MTPEVRAWARLMLGPADVRGRCVLEAGSLDVNGSLRPYVEGLRPRSYTGIDIVAGKGVDEVLAAEDILTRHEPDSFGVVISTEMLEHAERWRDALWAMMAVTAPGGLMLVTTRSPGFPRHEWPGDHWRFTLEDFAFLWTGWFVEDIRPDRVHPGVFLRARKPAMWDGEAARQRMARLAATAAPR